MSNGAGSGINMGVVVSVYLALVLFGLAFNLLTAWLEHKGYLRGFTSLLVAIGCLVTVGMTAVISLEYALVTAGAFAASGTPMILGSIWRYVTRREAELMRMRAEARDDNAEKALAERV